MSHAPDTQTELKEQGYEVGTPPPVDGTLPPGGGKWALPHYQSFTSIVNLASRTYRWAFDEALKKSHTNALAMRRDPVLMDALRSRQIPTAQLSWHLEAQDESDPEQVDAVTKLTEIIKECPRFQQFKMHLLESIWYGRYGVQVVYSWDWSRGYKRMVVRDFSPVNGDKLVFKYSGDVGIMVHPTFDGETETTDRGRVHFLTPAERECLVVHKFEPEDADFYEGDLAGQIEGVGIRSRLYYFWWLKSQIQQILMEYLQRVGTGIWVYYYEAGNKASLQEVQEAVESQHGNLHLLWPRYKDGSTGPKIEHIQPGTAGAQLLESMATNYFDDVMRRYVLGQTLSSETGATGLGSGVADAHMDTLGRIIKYDAVGLEETITHEFVRVLARYNCPGVPCPRFKFDVDESNAAEVLQSAQIFYEMGGDVDADHLRSVIGLEKPEPGHTVLSKLAPMQPTAVGSQPEGVPMQGEPGPVGDQPGVTPGDGSGTMDAQPQVQDTARQPMVVG